MGRTIFLTEEQIKGLISCSIIEEEDDKKESVNSLKNHKGTHSPAQQSQINKTRNEIFKQINNLANKNNNTEVINQIDRLGFYLPKNKEGRSEEGKNAMKKSLMKNGKITSKVNDEVKDAIRFWTKYNGYLARNENGEYELLLKVPEINGDEQKLNYYLRMRDALDTMGLNFSYDKSIKSKNYKFGIKSDNKGGIDLSDFDLNLFDDKYIQKNYIKNKGISLENGRALAIDNILQRYLNSRYGMEFKMPSTTFAAGNKKLPFDTLIINFTAAERCPAWAECIVKNACYARNPEKLHGNVMQANSKRNIMWEAAHQDPQLMKLLFRFIREHIVDYPMLCNVLSEKGIVETPENLSSKHFADLSDDIKSVIMNDDNILKIKNVRLNENGDFIGQWLISAVDDEAGDFNLIGVHTSAYTCRTLQFQKVKNIILNASNTKVGMYQDDNNNSQLSNAIARRFLALEEKIYDAYDETYGSDENNPTKLKLENGEIIRNPQPLYINGKETGYKYYKCPCGRKMENGDKADCYMCNFCYQPKTETYPVYVFVRVHGAGANEFSGNRKSYSFGVSKNFINNLQDNLNDKKNKALRQRYEDNFKDEFEYTKSQLNNNNLNENLMNSNNPEDAAIQQITQNTIDSVQNHLANLA